MGEVVNFPSRFSNFNNVQQQNVDSYENNIIDYANYHSDFDDELVEQTVYQESDHPLRLKSLATEDIIEHMVLDIAKYNIYLAKQHCYALLRSGFLSWSEAEPMVMCLERMHKNQ